MISKMVSHKIPHLFPIQNSKQLIVDGEPFLIRGAELQNSSFSSAKHMKPIWPQLVDMGLNTVLGSVSWELIEPHEGEFDFDELDQIILAAREYGLRIILLWFGAWKNGFSNYVPTWVKLSPSRFPRQEIRKDGQRKVLEVLSPMYQSTIDADAAAFCQLMKHLKEFDFTHNTVIIVQVENETGLLGDSRDYSDAATEKFNQPVPEDLVSFLSDEWSSLHPEMVEKLPKAWDPNHSNTSWSALLGDGPHADEMFQAYYYARYLDQIAQAGKAVYPLPMYANFWLNYHSDPMEQDYPVLAGGGDKPGDYPSGGGVSTVLDIWQKFAPHLDWISPDVYFNIYDKVCKTYRHRNQPLFFPEMRRDEYGARRLWRGIGSYQALGVSPFGVDSLGTDEVCAWKKHYQLLASVSDLILTKQREPESIQGFFFDELRADGSDPSPPEIFRMANYEVEIQRAFVCGTPGPGYGIIIYLGSSPCGDSVSRFLLIGAGFNAVFRSLKSTAYFTGILKFEEKELDESTGKLITRRRLNGDETRSGSLAIMPNEDPDYAGFPISITIPALTRIAECTVYSLHYD